VTPIFRCRLDPLPMSRAAQPRSVEAIVAATTVALDASTAQEGTADGPLRTPYKKNELVYTGHVST